MLGKSPYSGLKKFEFIAAPTSEVDDSLLKELKCDVNVCIRSIEMTFTSGKAKSDKIIQSPACGSPSYFPTYEAIQIKASSSLETIRLRSTHEDIRGIEFEMKDGTKYTIDSFYADGEWTEFKVAP